MRLAAMFATALASAVLLQSPAHAWYDDCRSYGTLNSNGQGTEVEICVSVDGSQRGAYLVGYQSGYSSVFVDITSIYLRQCDGYGSNCVVVRQESGFSGGGSSAAYQGQTWTVSYGHTYIACASLYVNSDRYTNVCSTFRTN